MDESTKLRKLAEQDPTEGLRKQLLEEASKAGLTPLEFLLAIQNNPNIELNKRIDAAKAAAPFVHAKLSSVDLTGKLSVSHEDALSALE